MTGIDETLSICWTSKALSKIPNPFYNNDLFLMQVSKCVKIFMMSE